MVPVTGCSEENLFIEELVASFPETVLDENPTLVTHGNRTSSRFSAAAWMCSAVFAQIRQSYGWKKTLVDAIINMSCNMSSNI